MAQIKFEDLPHIRKKHEREKIVFCSGVFDLTHAGHLLFFEDCKKQGDVLVVMAGSDVVVKRDRGTERPILNEHMRIKLIDSLRPVDYCFTDKLVPAEAHPLDYIDYVFRELKPDIYVVNDDTFDIPYRETMTNRHGVKLVILKRSCPPEFEKISTSNIIKKIKEAS